jgi:hypothetical protein
MAHYLGVGDTKRKGLKGGKTISTGRPCERKRPITGFAVTDEIYHIAMIERSRDMGRLRSQLRQFKPLR